MPKYIAVPRVIDAFLYTGDNSIDLWEFLGVDISLRRFSKDDVTVRIMYQDVIIPKDHYVVKPPHAPINVVDKITFEYHNQPVCN